ncbi:Acyl carrier protein (ACP1) [hydrothermal vent metagenome]|uniref:Acyl carrier protein (ACP1) n=1 Tax=hydrothermal vent metagenome TaxID=652676 RepID=A0A3B1DPW4_9ZZZZ
MDEQDNKKLEEVRSQLKELLVDHLSLEDIDPKSIKDDEPLFGDGLGLDSLDAVEIVVLLQRNFGLEVSDMEKGREIFYSIDTLAQYVVTNVKDKKDE